MESSTSSYMHEFYSRIQELTNSSNDYEQFIYDYNTLYDKIMENFEENITCAARNNKHHAYLFIYELDTKYQGGYRSRRKPDAGCHEQDTSAFLQLQVHEQTPWASL